MAGEGDGTGRVLAIGGLFFRSRDADALTRWYKEVLGVGAGCAAEGEPSEWAWQTQGGSLVFQPFRQESDYFAPDKAFMLNLRVSGLVSLIERLEARGIAVEQREEWNHPNTGRFARIHDPDGTPIELWEPPAAGEGNAA
jgi:catechol 2,3-dioxygenase-like lactoylglutathione lyase family enzyme